MAATLNVTEIPRAVHQSQGQLFRCCLPLSKALDPEDKVVAFLRAQAGEASPVVVVAIPPLDEIKRLTDGAIDDIVHFYAARGVECLHAPWVEKYEADNRQLLQDLVGTVVSRLQNGATVAVHCHSGFGRGGVVLAAVLAALRPSLDAIAALQDIDAQFLAQEKPRRWIKDFLEARAASL